MAPKRLPHIFLAEKKPLLGRGCAYFVRRANRGKHEPHKVVNMTGITLQPSLLWQILKHEGFGGFGLRRVDAAGKLPYYEIYQRKSDLANRKFLW